MLSRPSAWQSVISFAPFVERTIVDMYSSSLSAADHSGAELRGGAPVEIIDSGALRLHLPSVPLSTPALGAGSRDQGISHGIIPEKWSPPQTWICASRKRFAI